MNIKLPKSITELRQRHLEAMSKVDLETITILDRADLFSSFTGVDMKLVKRMAFEDVMKVLEHYFTIIASHEAKDLPKEIEIEGVKYCLIKAAEKMPTDWHIDMSGFEMNDPCTVAAFYYIEKGMEYCQKDKNSNILNPVKARADLFREHLPANILIDLRFFFQKKLTNYKRSFMANLLMGKRANLIDMSGKTQLMQLPKN